MWKRYAFLAYNKGMNKKIEKLFLWVLCITTCARLLFAAIVPITGDEAYFITWAKHLDYGYYEHPPMIGWIMWLFSFFGSDIFVYRLFPVLCVPVIAIILVRLLADIDRNNAFLCGVIFLLSPVSMLNVLSVNDVPLIFFSFLSGVFFYRGLKTDKIIDAILSGFFWGCAFLSKYFAVLLAVSVLIFSVIKRNRKIWKITGIAVLSSIPLILLNLAWNYNHCWTNLTFNLFFRNKDIALKFSSFFVFLIEQVFLMTPYLAFVFLRKRFFLKECKTGGIELFWFLFLVPFSFFLCLSFLKNIGLHWMASFYPFFFMIIVFLQFSILDRAARYNFYLSIGIVIIIIALVSIPPGVFRNTKKYSQIIMFFEPQRVADEINRNLDGRIPAATGYTETSIFSYYCKRDFIMMGSLSRSGRYYDFITDFKNFDGKNFLIVSLNKKDAEKLSNYFKKIDVKEVDIMGASFFMISGEHFIYNQYRDIYLSRILKMYYTVPGFLPRGRNFFVERYFPELVYSK